MMITTIAMTMVKMTWEMVDGIFDGGGNSARGGGGV
jgi:hypothetical protein